MARVRHAVAADVPRLVEIGRGMHAESPHYRHLGYVEEKVAAALHRAIESGAAFVHLDGEGKIDGGFAAVVVERWFSHDRMVTDLALFVRPEGRGGMAAYVLLTTFIAWCKDRGFAPEDVVIGITTGVHEERTAMLYERLGFERFGSLYRLRGY